MCLLHVVAGRSAVALLAGCLSSDRLMVGNFIDTYYTPRRAMNGETVGRCTRNADIVCSYVYGQFSSVRWSIFLESQWGIYGSVMMTSGEQTGDLGRFSARILQRIISFQLLMLVSQFKFKFIKYL